MRFRTTHAGAVAAVAAGNGFSIFLLDDGSLYGVGK
jgi:hypothetical protein